MFTNGSKSDCQIISYGGLAAKTSPLPTCDENKLNSRKTKLLSTLLKQINDDGKHFNVFQTTKYNLSKNIIATLSILLVTPTN